MRAGRKQDKRGKRKDKRTKSRTNTPQAFNPPNSTRAQKAPQATQSTQATQTHTTATKPAENRLKMRNRAIFQANAPRAKQESRQKAGTHDQRTRANPWQVLKPRKPAHLRTSGHDERQARNAPPSTHFVPTFQNIFDFRPFLSPKFPIKHQAPPKIYSLLPIFARLSENLPRLSENLPRGKLERRMK